MRKATRQGKHAAQTQAEIVRVALHLFSTSGYDATTIQNICETANVSVGAFYYYYTSKEDILTDSYRKFDQVLQKRYADSQFDEPLQGIAQIQNTLATSIQNRGYRIAAQIFKNQLKDGDPFILRKDRTYCQLIWRLVNEAFARGDFHPAYSVQTITETILRVGRGIVYDWCLYNGAYDLPEKVRFGMQIILCHFKQEPNTFSAAIS